MMGSMKFLQRLFSPKPVPKTEEEIAALIEGFANGTGGRWDCDYFMSTHFENERINWAQKECFKVEDEYPRTGRVAVQRARAKPGCEPLHPNYAPTLKSRSWCSRLFP